MKTFCVNRSSLFIFSALLIAGCGNSNKEAAVSPQNSLSAVTVTPNPITPVTTTCSSGSYNIGGRGCLTGTFQQVCLMLPGATYVTISGQNVCRLRSQYAVNFVGSNSYLARLTPDDAAGSYAFPSRIQVYANDKVDVSASGSWGTISYDLKSYLGGFFNTWSTSGNCNQVRVDGKSVSSGSAVTNNENGQSAGLWMSDGTQTYFIGSHAKQSVVNAGSLYFGVNAPAEGSKCGSINVSSIVIDHCENDSGTSISCY